MQVTAQPGLFDTAQSADREQEFAARARMHGMIERLRSTSTPFWANQMAVILDDGAFKRAMQLVPPAEAQALWADYDAHMERLFAIWAEAQPAP